MMNALLNVFFTPLTLSYIAGIISENLYTVLIATFFIVALFLMVFIVMKSRRKILNRFDDMLYVDELTQLKNANYLTKNFNDILIEFDEDVTMYYLNIDSFKNYNDLLGYRLASKILIEMRNRLMTIVSPHHSVYRIHSDHFVLLYPTKSDRNNQFSKRLLRTLKEPYTISVHTIKLTVSIGRYQINIKNPRFNDCLLKSELALQEAKALGKDQIVYYSRDIKNKNQNAFTTFRLIKDALKEKRFFLEYQPIVSSADYKVVGLESLVRIKHHNKILYPQDIMTYAEKYHLIEDIDYYVIRASFEAFKRFEQKLDRFEFMSINISTKEINNKAFIEYVVKQAELLEVNPKKITIEFTETYYPEDLSKESDFIKTLQNHGFKVAIDDFGSGYSSMIRLSQNQLDKIKIDRSFITDIAHSESNQNIVKSLVDLSNTFGLDVIVEGVETEEDLNFIQSVGVKYIQGYYFYQAMSEDAIINSLMFKV